MAAMLSVGTARVRSVRPPAESLLDSSIAYDTSRRFRAIAEDLDSRTVKNVKSNTTTLHSRADGVITIADAVQLVANDGLSPEMLVEVGNDRRLTEPEPLHAMLEECERLATRGFVMDKLDPQTALIFSFYEGMKRKGPGSVESTRKALSMLDGLPATPDIVDFGCGAGAASIALASAMPCRVTAVDVYQPFLEEVEANAAREGLADRIRTVQGDMADPPFPEESFDLIWSEGAIYNIGFEQGLKCWRRLLRSGGFVAATELTWLSDAPPKEVMDFWEHEYPAMTNTDDNLRKLRSADFEPVGDFILSSGDWENYYAPLEQHLAAFRSKHSENVKAQILSDATQQEIDIWKQYGSSYGYVFYLGRAS